MRILIIEDNLKLAASLKRGFEQEGYAADYLLNGEDGERRAIISQSDHDIIVLDITLPQKSGIDVCRALREHGIMTPIIMLTARDTVDDKIRGLDSGADDYLIKPFSFAELISRVRAIARRPRNTLPPELSIGELILMPATQEVFYGEEKLNLTLTEFRLLEFFMSKPNEVITRQKLVDHLWDYDFDPTSRVMDVHINNLRNKLRLNKEGPTLETVRGVGYRLQQ